jgi:soluble lytic murein transglycosylase-like protein
MAGGNRSAFELGLARTVVLSVFVAACGAPAASAPTVAPTPTIRYTPMPTATPKPVIITPAPTASPTPGPKFDELPEPANNPGDLARQIAMLEAGLRDPASTPEQIAWYGHLEQMTVGRLADFPEWKDAVLAELPEALRVPYAGTLEAGRQLRMMYGPIPTRLPDWKIVAPAPIEDLMAYYKEAEAAFGVPWYYLAAIHLVETRMGRIRGLSSAGAQGPMQFMPATWAAYGQGDVNDPHDAILGAARYLKASGAPGDMQRALFAYNHSQFYVNALMQYATVMKNDPLAYRGYHGWQVYYPTKDGVIHMPVGWVKT